MAGTTSDPVDENPATSTAHLLAQIAAAAGRLLAGPGAGSSAAEADPADLPMEQVLAGLVALRQLRARLETWEPGLIEAARDVGASWAQLAPALGVASRQAAERRYLRLRKSDHDEVGVTRDERVQAERDRRAADRAVSAWARARGADLRQLAGQVTALTDLSTDAQPSLDRLHHALGGNDAAALVPLLANTHEHLPASHAALAEQITAVAHDTDQVRQATRNGRTRRRTPDETGPRSS